MPQYVKEDILNPEVKLSAPQKNNSINTRNALSPDCQSMEKNYKMPLYPLSDEGPSIPTGPPLNAELEEHNPSEMTDTNLIKAEGLLFDDETIRKGFIRKVYSILMCQLLVTLLIITFFIYHKPTKYYFHTHKGYFYGILIFTAILVLFMACCTNLRRKAPMNYVFLFIFTLAESFLVGFIASLYAPETVLLAAGLTVVVCLALTMFAFQTKWDFTRLNASLFIALLLLTAFGIAAIFLYSKIMSLIYATCGVLLFSLYLIHDTQVMMGGKHRYSISPEEYIFGALNLYIDIIRIFLHLLSIRV